MEKVRILIALVSASCVAWGAGGTSALSSDLIHRFSDEARAAVASRGGIPGWPIRRTVEYYRILARNDFQRQRRRLGTRFQIWFPSDGSETVSFGNDFGWAFPSPNGLSFDPVRLYYTWISIGTPNVSFLVALDAGSDLLWVPCDCVQCAPLSGYPSLDKDLSMYNPAKSRTSKYLSCNNELCSSQSSCDNPENPCPYSINYSTENTSSSGLLVEDKFHMASSENRLLVNASVLIGCGRMQSGYYLDGVAPDGLLGLGFGAVSVPSFLARTGLIHDSFSLCFRDDDSGRILFGDKGPSTQQSTSFITVDGKIKTYAIAVESFCIGSHCPVNTNFHALVDSGSSFTFLPDSIYKRVAMEFDRQVNVSRIATSGESTWEYCYEASPLGIPGMPKVTLIFGGNKSFVAMNPIYPVYTKEGELAAFCLALQSSPEYLGTIGQNFMTGYHMVFDRENLKLGWSQSDCHALDNSRQLPLGSPPHDRPENPLPTNEQYRSPPGTNTISPAVAGRTPTANASPGSEDTKGWYSFLLLIAVFAIG
ncbi:hypothetical protein ZIOFF_053785 [Zingiber officinale]|uniref:Peptidase A1 domain-containing protein n=1 Tax=Zingiber officinale TaxID=94328 RepID=A0A8J5KD64_ZINOF|nr:hypothetical protein ZIOFF_053785 [Zingiber officinale]